MIRACRPCAGWRQDEDLEAAPRGLSMSDDGSPSGMHRSLDLRPPATVCNPVPNPAVGAPPTTPNPLTAAQHTGSSPRGSPRTPVRAPPVQAAPSVPPQERSGAAGADQVLHDRVALQLGRGYK